MEAARFNAVNAVIYDFAAARRCANQANMISLQDALKRIERCCQWLEGAGLIVIGFRKPLFAAPYVTVSAKPTVYNLFAGRYERLGHRQEGVLRYEVWEGRDRINQIAVRWVEVTACA